MSFTISRRNPVCFIFFLLLLSGFSPRQSQDFGYPSFKDADVIPALLRAEVIGIQDGDTIELKWIYNGKKAGQRNGRPLRIRFLHIDCPERGRPFYQVAKQFTSSKCFRQTVQIRNTGKFDQYGRLLGEVILPDGRVLNKELVRNGLAIHFKKYSDNKEYAQLEVTARNQKLGIWSLPADVVFGNL